jgi:hypothetical protein
MMMTRKQKERIFFPDRSPKKRSIKRKDTLDRLKNTVAFLEARKELPDGVTERRIAIQEAGKALHDKAFSTTTLSHRRYLPYWHPKYRVSREPTGEDRRKEPTTRSFCTLKENET